MTAALTSEEVLALPALIDVPTVAAALGGIGRATVYREVTAGRFPLAAVRVGSRVLFRRADVVVLLGLDGPQAAPRPDGPQLALVAVESATPRAG